ncbi:uncharacterized protein PAC_18654 [Phialocephala subalpina]|uniref:Xylanolytic transcriptional activator regulatory domain-containing protein n=1 Tax=Phialocephala subalpina TaxID=576137 RepID=A0A1L7XUR5_9HELO|nr:uncharacterized protein PAC_18654 [Phialocephala subalpina]
MAAPDFDLCYAGVNMEEIFRLSADIDLWNAPGVHESSNDTFKPPQSNAILDITQPSPLSSIDNINPSAQTPDQIFLDGNADFWTDTIEQHSRGPRQTASGDWPHTPFHASEFFEYGSKRYSALWDNINVAPLDPSLRDELVMIYFRNVHPLCPIIDEQQFYHHYFAFNKDGFLDMFPSILFNSMIFAAFAHARDEQLQRAGFESVWEAQTEYFQSLKKMYECARFEIWTEIDELVLAKASLLLSFWCGPKLDVTVNSVWADRAIYHTRQYLLKSTSQVTLVMPKRRDILYWCCLARNAFISYAMRRPHRLHIEENLLCEPDAVRSEFDREVIFHNFSSPQGKLRMIEDFVTMCKLSLNLSAMLKLQRSELFQLQWNASEPDVKDKDKDEPETEDNLHHYLVNYLEAAKFETDVSDLIREYEENQRQAQTPEGASQGEELTSEQLLGKLRAYTLSLIAHSSIATLYQSTISTPSGSWAKSCQQTGLSRLRSACASVSQVAGRILLEIEVESIPGTLLSWTILPLVMFLVEENCRRVDPHDPPQDNPIEIHPEMEKLLELTNMLAPRFQSAREHWSVMQEVNRLIRSSAALKRPPGVTFSSSGSEEGSRKRRRTSSNVGRRETMELEFLNQAMGFLDRSLAYGAPAL